MRCQFCKQDVENPCHNVREVQQRASSHIGRCEKALKTMHQDMGHSGAGARDVQSGGRH